MLKNRIIPGYKCFLYLISMESKRLSCTRYCDSIDTVQVVSCKYSIGANKIKKKGKTFSNLLVH